MRATIPPGEWRKLRIALLARYGFTCATCGKEETVPGHLKAHEVWQYDEVPEPARARIAGLSLLCWHCHAIEHWRATCAIVREQNLTRAIEDTITHFCRLNGATQKDFVLHLAAAEEDWDRQSRREWHVDYGVFTEWMAKTYPRDVLNNDEWPPAFQTCWTSKLRPTMEDIVSQLPHA